MSDTSENDNDQTHDPTRDQHESTPGSSGDDGVRDTSVRGAPGDAPPEQAEGGDEPQPEGLEPKAGYPSADPRHERKPYDPGGR